jgi:signal recognition particle subunit SRP72
LQLYRAEDFAKVAELYDRLSEKGIASEGHDLSINQSAVEAQIYWKDPTTLQRRRPGREDLEAFETAYNVACASIATGEFAKAEVLLRRAKGNMNILGLALTNP